MNIMEETPGEYRINITGLSIRQIKDIFENEYGALMWNGGGAYPCDGVTLQFKSTDGPAAMPVGELTHLKGVDAGPLSEWVDLVTRGYVSKNELLIMEKDAVRVAAARSQPTTEESLAVAGAKPLRELCWCTTCRPITIGDMRFVVCPDCGNKRCPKAHNHTLECTNSNEPGQRGSSWENIKPAPHGITKKGE